MVKVRRVLETKFEADLLFKQMNESGDFDKTKRWEQSVRGLTYYVLCGFSHQKKYIMRNNMWSDAETIDELVLPDDIDFNLLYPAPKKAKAKKAKKKSTKVTIDKDVSLLVGNVQAE